MKAQLIFLSLLMWAGTLLAGIDPPTYMKWRGTEIDQGSVLLIEDPFYQQMTNSAFLDYQNLSCKNEITFRLNPFSGDLGKEYTFDANLEAEIDLYKADGSVETITKKFEINYDPRPGTSYTAQSYFAFEDAY